ncbi:MAG: hypothetical protein SO402_02835 [Prevotella sp.]|nr:hypothetical protein [Prevotella sp.]MDD6820759.1 hypothetical protein [Prevotella sp.]MDY4653285.1 hypothetical protein [Prevotella sp.]
MQALLSDFELKRERIAEETLKKNMTNLSGVPSWITPKLSGPRHAPQD